MRLKRCVVVSFCLMAGPFVTSLGYAQIASNIVTVSWTTTNSTPLNSGFAGFTTELLGTGVEYGDTNMQRLAAQLSPGWLLFPAGETGDAFNWATGLTVQNWVNEFGANGDLTTSNLTQNTCNALLGKGGVWLTNFASLAQNLGGAKIVVCVNGFTDTAESAGAFAAYALSNHIPVAVWELCNEPYLFQGSNNFFTNGDDYANKMEPYCSAIKAADSNATVAVFFTDPGLTGNTWNKALGNYTNRYWDAAVYHHYPRVAATIPFSDQMALDNATLASNCVNYVTNDLMTNNRAGVTYLLTEMNPALGNGDGTQNPPTATLYGGIFASEYVMRLSAIPQMALAGSYQLVNGSGVDTTNHEWNAVDNAGIGGYVTNTVGLPFGYFLSAQGSAEAVAYWAINRSSAVYPTATSTNGPVVSNDTNGVGTMPALYAQAYQGNNGKRYVLLTNKGSNCIPVELTQDSFDLTNSLLETYVTGTNPAVLNSNPPSNNIVILSAAPTNPVTLSPYSVTRLEWTVFDVPAPPLAITPSAPAGALAWTGLSNVVYDVEATTNFASWATLGKVSAANTNFNFADPNSNAWRFYRLAVP